MKLSENGKEFRIICGIPMLDHPEEECFIAFIHCVLGQIFEHFGTCTGTLLPMARNVLVDKAYAADPNFTHFMFIDADMGLFGPQEIVKLIVADKDIITGVCTMRKPPFMIVNSFKDPKQLPIYLKEGAIVEAPHVGLAFTLIKREVLDTLREETPGAPIWFNTDREERDSFPVERDERIRDLIKILEERTEVSCQTENRPINGQHYYPIFPDNIYTLLDDLVSLGQFSHVGTQLVGEDVSFSHKAIKAGFKCWVHCGVLIGHQSVQMRSARDAKASDLDVLSGNIPVANLH